MRWDAGGRGGVWRGRIMVAVDSGGCRTLGKYTLKPVMVHFSDDMAA